MALSPAEVKKYREAYGIGSPEPSQATTTVTESPQERINRLKAGSAPTSTETPNVAAQGGYSAMPKAPVTPPPEPKKNIFGKIVDFGVDVAKDAAESLLVKPAARTAEAAGRLGVFGPTIQRGYEEMAETGQQLKTPIGSYDIEGVKTGMSGAKQIGGEALKAGSWLIGGGGAKNAAGAAVQRKAGTAIIQAAKAGAASGGMYGAGDALEQDKSAGEVVKEGAIGAAVGGLAGGAVGAVPAVVGGTAAATKGIFKGGQKAVNAIDDIGTRSAEVATRAPKAQKAIKAGIDDNVVDFLETAAPEDQQAFKRIFNLAREGAKDMRIGREQLAKREAARPILNRAEHLIKTKDLGVAQTNRVLNSLDQSPVDVSNVFYTFLNDLRNKGITVVKRGNGYQFVNQGAIPEGDLGAYKIMLKILQPDESGQVLRSYRGLHTGRQRIFNELNLAKARQQTFSDDVVRYAERFRSLLADPIDQASKGVYRSSQKRTAESLQALREFVQLIGYKGDLEKITTKDLKAAEVASRVLGNAADRPTSVLQAMDDVARKYGYKGKENLIDQVQFADLMEDIFGTTQTRSLRGQTGRGALDAFSEATGAAQEATSGNILALGSRALKAVIGKSKEDQILALEELIESLGRSKTNFGR